MPVDGDVASVWRGPACGVYSAPKKNALPACCGMLCTSVPWTCMALCVGLGFFACLQNVLGMGMCACVAACVLWMCNVEAGLACLKGVVCAGLCQCVPASVVGIPCQAGKWEVCRLVLRCALCEVCRRVSMCVDACVVSVCA